MSRKTKKFLSYYKPYLGMFTMDMICAMIAATVTLILPLIIRYITQTVLVQEIIDFSIIYKLAIFMIVLIIIEFVSMYYITYKGHVMGAYMEQDMRRELFGHFQELSFGFYDEQKTGQLMSRLTNDLFLLTELYHHGPEDIVIGIIKFVGAFVILSSIHLKLTLYVFAVIPFMAVFAWYFNKKLKTAFKRTKERVGDVNARIEDNLSGIRVVKSFASEDLEKEKFALVNDGYVESKTYSYFCLGRYHSGLGAMTNFIYLVAIFSGAFFIIGGELSTGDMITFILYISNLIDPVKKLINFTEQFQDGVASFDRFMELIDTKPTIQDKDDAIELKDVVGNVSFKNVCFRYNDTTDYVLNNTTLDVKAGDYVAFVGQSGVGKTTICSLLPRFYEINEGSICVDDINIQDVTQDSLRKNIGIVQQDVYLFAGTVMDNIRYGNMECSDEEVIEAAKKANAHEFIMALPYGYQTDCGQRGVKLSGGQKQRLSIARVFLKNPPILIFDEATSALDNESERIVQESLEALAINRTTFVIAHRLSTIKNAKRICVLSKEGICEEGTHDDLLALNGTYSNLYNMQFKTN